MNIILNFKEIIRQYVAPAPQAAKPPQVALGIG